VSGTVQGSSTDNEVLRWCLRVSVRERWERDSIMADNGGPDPRQRKRAGYNAMTRLFVDNKAPSLQTHSGRSVKARGDNYVSYTPNHRHSQYPNMMTTSLTRLGIAFRRRPVNQMPWQRHWP